MCSAAGRRHRCEPDRDPAPARGPARDPGHAPTGPLRLRTLSTRIPAPMTHDAAARRTLAARITPRRLDLLLLAGTLLLAFGLLRGTANPAPHPGGDNAAYVALGHALATGAGYVESWDPSLAPHTKYPPVWPAALALAQRTGADSWHELKGLARLFALGAVLATWLFARGRLGPVAASLVALTTAGSFSFLDHASWLLSDVPFLGLLLLGAWLAERALRPDARPGAEGAAGADSAAEAEAEAESGSGAAAWLVAAAVVAALAALTRTAGLPLVVALVGALAWRGRWRGALVTGVLAGVPLMLWALRGRGVAQEGAYGREFWLVDPYRPELGEIGLGALPARALDNLGSYLGNWLPATLGGPDVGVGGVVVLGLVMLALVGWVRALRRGLGAAELFLPLYAGIVLVWPSVWGGDRFALPLVPLLLVWAAAALDDLTRGQTPWLRRGSALGAGLLLLVPIATGVNTAAESARLCRSVIEEASPWACSGLAMVEFTEAARWAGVRLPDEAVVLVRKPRIWHVMSGQATRTYPFSTSGDTLLAVADRAGARYVVLDRISAQAVGLAEAIGARIGSFCSVASFGSGEAQLRTELLGILPPAARTGGSATTGEARLAACPPDFVRDGPALSDYRSSSPIPLLAASGSSFSPRP